METEEKLTIEWLAQRQRFDVLALDPALRAQALARLDNISEPLVADIGAGTGNNALSLLPALPKDAQLVLVEQHAYLLEACKTRLASRSADYPGLTLRYQQCDLHAWLDKQHDLDLLCNSALLDLFTRPELEALIQAIADNGTAMYSTLNYCGIRFSPEHKHDGYYIGLFEHHMCRQLDRGKPLGPKVLDALTDVLEKHPGLQLEVASSPWVISASDTDFIRQNLSFYQRGISALLVDNQEIARFTAWFNDKLRLLDEGKLSLTVDHRDFLVFPAG